MDIKVRKIYIEAIKKILPDIYKNGKTDEKCPFCMKDIVYEYQSNLQFQQEVLLSQYTNMHQDWHQFSRQLFLGYTDLR